MLPYVSFPFLQWVKFCGGFYRLFFFSFGRQKKWLLVALGRWSSYTVTVVWEFAWADSASVILYEWMSYRGGCLNRFYCSCILGLGNSCADFTGCVSSCPSVRTCIMWKQVNRFLSYMAFWFTWLVSLCWGVFTGGYFWIG